MSWFKKKKKNKEENEEESKDSVEEEKKEYSDTSNENPAESTSSTENEEEKDDSPGVSYTTDKDGNPVEVHEIMYERATIPRRVSSNLLDTFLSLILGFILLCATFSILNNNDYMNELQVTRNTVAVESGLYEWNDDGITTTRTNVSIVDDTELTANEKIEKLYDILYTFYQDDRFFEDDEGLEEFYDSLATATDEDDNLLFDEDYNRVFTSSDYDDVYLDFFDDLFDYSTGFLANDSTFFNANQKFILIYIFSTIGTMLIPFIIFYYIIPMCFVRTRQTLGGLVTKTAIINYNGLAVSWKKFTLRFIFMFIIEIIGSIFAFLIPLIVSITMMVCFKSHQNLHDYIFSTYCVDVTNRTIYKDIYEYKLSLDESPKYIRLEDEDYKPHVPER